MTSQDDAIRPLPPVGVPQADVSITSDRRGRVTGSASIQTADGASLMVLVCPGAGVSAVLRQPNGASARISYARNGMLQAELLDGQGNSLAVDRNGLDLTVGGNWLHVGVDSSGSPVSVDGMLALPGGAIVSFGKHASGGTIAATIPAPGGGAVQLGFDASGHPSISGNLTTDHGTKVTLETDSGGRVTVTASSPNVPVTRGILPRGSSLSVSAWVAAGGGERIAGSVSVNALFPHGAAAKAMAAVETDGSFTAGIAIEWVR